MSNKLKIPNQNKIRKENRLIRKKNNENYRTSLMLVVVCLLFLIAELPQFVMIILSVIDRNFYENVYSLIGELLDIIVLISGSINFILYCIMSQSFRKTFRSMFKCSFCCSKQINEE